MATKKKAVLDRRGIALLKSNVAKIEKAKARLAKDCDELRELHSELEDIVSSANLAEEDISAGLRYISDGIDGLSGYL